jgi:hypothetical protein
MRYDTLLMVYIWIWSVNQTVRAPMKARLDDMKHESRAQLVEWGMGGRRVMDNVHKKLAGL